MPVASADASAAGALPSHGSGVPGAEWQPPDAPHSLPLAACGNGVLMYEAAGHASREFHGQCSGCSQSVRNLRMVLEHVHS